MSGPVRWGITGFVLGLAFVVTQGTVGASSPQPQIKYVAVKPVASPDGPSVYRDYCAVCHGPAARGNGPASRALETPVPDLTRIALRDGTFNPYHVMVHVGHLDPAQPSPMPQWGRLLNGPGGSRAMTQVILVNLTSYLDTLQVTP